MVLTVALSVAAVSVVSQQPYEPPAYAAVRGIDRYATEAEYREATTDPAVTLSRITYTSGGLEVVGYLYRLSGTGAPRPVVVFSRGSYVVNGEVPLYLASFHRLARSGFMVFAPMFRGSDGAPGHDELGGRDLDDLLNAIALARQLPDADPANVFLYGESRGGVMTLEALREHAQVNAAATVGAFTNLAQYFLETPGLEKSMAGVIWPDYADRRDEILRHRSAMRWADRIDTPLLIMHGGQDRSVSPTHALALATELQKLGKDYGLTIVSGDGHVLAAHRVERDAEVVAWFKAHLAAASW